VRNVGCAALGDYYLAVRCGAVRRGEPITDDLLARVEKANAENFSRGCSLTIQEAVATPLDEVSAILKDAGRL